jgi:hypothetical protein
MRVIANPPQKGCWKNVGPVGFVRRAVAPRLLRAATLTTLAGGGNTVSIPFRS